MPKYTRTTFKLVVLSSDMQSDEPVSNLSMSQLSYEVVEGNCSGKLTVESEEELTEAQMSQALTDQGSDPSFLIPEEEDE